ncbi:MULTISPECIES: HAD hydrolase family protein [Arthrobacter]|uniref:HAD hydrolase family protein n=2 Tax=Arthrobacter TaxID=1663 RepID=A0ABU9KHY5_9MICC|nr:HAD hydrolase family protein [Arthrobacter sp. YJM1]MDP5225765.1 HAD hydrolase family protein [Arthrobacter sp. YJM1]
MSSLPPTRPRAVFLDIDGTYADHGLVPDAHVEAVELARSRGHRVFLCTGRPLAMIADRILAPGFDGVISGAGAHVEVGGELLVDTRFDQDLADRVIDALDTHNAAYILEAPHSLHGRRGVDLRLRDVLSPIFAAREQTHGRHGATVDPTADILAPMQYADDLRGTSFAKVSCFDSDTPLTEVVADLGPAVGLVPSSLSALGDTAGEIYVSGIHKAVGIRVVQDYLGLLREDIIAIGDSANDLEMLRYAGIGVAVDGATPDVLAAADRTTGGPAEHGVAHALAELGLLG